MFKFKDVEVAFKMQNLPKYDQEYLKTMTYEIVQSNSVLHTGKSFDTLYPNADNFTLFDSREQMHLSMSDYKSNWGSYASHLLHGKKYWLAWTYDY
jgi:hypothetical protein